MTLQESKLKVQSADGDFVLTRIIDAPRERVFKAWADPQKLAKWWGPRQFPAYCQGEIKVGSSFRLVMVGPDGKEFPMTAVVKELKEPERLVWLQDVSEHPHDWHELINKGRAGASGNIGPMLLTITFEALEGKTKMTVAMQFERAGDREALVTNGMTAGWSESFEKLEELLAA
ncbi:MAG TPA: SRPBCC domain-containing protein [Chroococcales cyanobacterium]